MGNQDVNNQTYNYDYYTITTMPWVGESVYNICFKSYCNQNKFGNKGNLSNSSLVSSQSIVTTLPHESWALQLFSLWSEIISSHDPGFRRRLFIALSTGSGDPQTRLGCKVGQIKVKPRLSHESDHSWWQYPVWAMDPAGALQQPGARTQSAQSRGRVLILGSTK